MFDKHHFFIVNEQKLFYRVTKTHQLFSTVIGNQWYIHGPTSTIYERNCHLVDESSFFTKLLVELIKTMFLPHLCHTCVLFLLR